MEFFILGLSLANAKNSYSSKDANLTFYSMINIKPVGKNVISVCNNVSCMLNGSDEIIRHIEKKLKIKVGASTPDKRFYLKDEVECLAACTGAPMMQVNHVNYENLTKEKVDKILDKIK